MSKIFHILVKHDYEAKDILKKMNEGLSFEQAARKFSSCPSAKDGGYLGEFKPGRYVEAFEEAVVDLKVDKVSVPIRTQFGYHLILKTN